MPRPLWFSETPDAPLDGRTGALLWETVADVLNDRRCDDAREDPSAVDRAAAPRTRVARGVVARAWCGWEDDSAALRASLGSLLSFYPAAGATESGVAFSDTLRAADRAVVRPSVAFWQWLRSPGAPPWQMRGELKLTATDVIALVGPHIAAAAAGAPPPAPAAPPAGGGADAVAPPPVPEHAPEPAGRAANAREARPPIKLLSTSLWAGNACTRTPLHVDRVHALVLQLAGTKRFFLASERDVRAAAHAGRLPRAVAETGNTQDFVADASAAHGDLDAVHGLHVDADEPTAVRTTVGEHVTLAPGDMLVLPSGLYHDVQCGAEGVGLSLTVRFELVDDNDPGDDAAASQPVAATDETRAQKLQRMRAMFQQMKA